MYGRNRGKFRSSSPAVFWREPFQQAVEDGELYVQIPFQISGGNKLGSPWTHSQNLDFLHDTYGPTRRSLAGATARFYVNTPAINVFYTLLFKCWWSETPNRRFQTYPSTFNILGDIGLVAVGYKKKYGKLLFPISEIKCNFWYMKYT